MNSEVFIADRFIKAIDDNFSANSDLLSEVAQSLFSTIQKGGIVQLFGVGPGEEFVNELFFRAGGLSPFHGIKVSDLLTRGMIEQSKIDDMSVYQDASILEDLLSIYKLDDRDAYVLVSQKGNEPLIVKMALYAKSKGQKVIALVNKNSYDVSPTIDDSGERLLDIADLAIMTTLDEPDILVEVDGHDVGQLFGTVANVLAQCLEAEIYKLYVENGIEAPVLLSANVKGADVHNNALTDAYEGRVR